MYELKIFSFEMTSELTAYFYNEYKINQQSNWYDINNNLAQALNIKYGNPWSS